MRFLEFSLSLKLSEHFLFSSVKVHCTNDNLVRRLARLRTLTEITIAKEGRKKSTKTNRKNKIRRSNENRILNLKSDFSNGDEFLRSSNAGGTNHQRSKMLASSLNEHRSRRIGPGKNQSSKPVFIYPIAKRFSPTPTYQAETKTLDFSIPSSFKKQSSEESDEFMEKSQRLKPPPRCLKYPYFKFEDRLKFLRRDTYPVQVPDSEIKNTELTPPQSKPIVVALKDLTFNGEETKFRLPSFNPFKGVIHNDSTPMERCDKNIESLKESSCVKRCSKKYTANIVPKDILSMRSFEEFQNIPRSCALKYKSDTNTGCSKSNLDLDRGIRKARKKEHDSDVDINSPCDIPCSDEMKLLHHTNHTKKRSTDIIFDQMI